MEQHPIPQQISSYQFRLVGDMTLKQFFQLAGGILVGLLFYSSPLLPIIKWPFAISSVILGIALAFLPLEERPLEKWIFAFFRAVYSPTLYYWKKTEVRAKFFQDENPADPNAPKQDAAIESYLGQNAKKDGPLQNLEAAEKGFLAQLTGIFSGATQQAKPAEVVQPAQTTGVPVQQVVVPPVAAPVKPIPTAPTEQTGIQIPQMQPIRVVHDANPKLVVEERRVENGLPSDIQASQASPVVVGNEMVMSRSAVFSVDAAPPSPPTYPNTIVGQVVDQDKKIVEGAIMEIKDTMGRPIRALKSNKLGHFITVTPVESGKYEIITEKDGFEFAQVSFEAGGQIIPPILVSGKRLQAPEVVTPNPPTNLNETQVLNPNTVPGIQF